jgi:hypothetical protein
MNRSSSLNTDGYLLNFLADQAIVTERHLSCQSGDFYLAIFGDFNVAIDNSKNVSAFN